MDRDKQEKLRYWETAIAEYRASGLSAAAYCHQAGIKASTFHYWAKKLALDRREVEIAEKLPEWVSIPVKLEPASISIHIGQATIDVGPGCDGGLLSLVLKTMMTIC